MIDAALQSSELLDQEIRSGYAASDALSEAAFGTEAEYLDAMWGGDGVRTAVAEKIMGPAPYARLLTKTAPIVRTPPPPHASTVVRDQAVVSTLSLMQQNEVPVLGAGNENIEEWARGVYDLLDHRLAARAGVGPYRYEFTVAGSPVPNPARDALIANAEVSAAEFDGEYQAGTRSLGAVSVLVRDYALDVEDVRAALRYASDLVRAFDVSRERRDQVGPGATRPRLVTARFARVAPLDLFAYAASLQDVQNAISPVPRGSTNLFVDHSLRSFTGFGAWGGLTVNVGTGSGSGTAYNHYSVGRVAEDGNLGAAGAAHHLRVALLQLERLMAPTGDGAPTPFFFEPEAVRDARRALDAQVGTRWSEATTKELVEDCGPTIRPLPGFPSDPPWCGQSRLRDIQGVGTEVPVGPRWSLYGPTSDPLLAGTFASSRTMWIASEAQYDVLEHGTAPLPTSLCGAAPLRLAEDPEYSLAGIPVVPQYYASIGYRIRRFQVPACARTTAAGATAWYVLSPRGTAPERYDVVDYFLPRQGTSVHALGGELGVKLGEVLERLPENPARPKATFLGFSSDEVPPLENSITTDGDLTEDSFATYLGFAREAAARADALQQDAETRELETIRNAVADSSSIDAVRQEELASIADICGPSAATVGPSCADVPRRTLTLGEITFVDPILHGPPIALVEDPVDQRDLLRTMGVGRLGSLGVSGVALLEPAACVAYVNGLSTTINHIVDLDNDDWDDETKFVFTKATRCMDVALRDALRKVEVRDVPTAVLEELARGGMGDFPGLAGEIRDQHSRIFGSLRSIGLAARALKTAVASAISSTEALAYRIDDLSPSDLEALACVLGKIAVVAGAAASVVATLGGSAVVVVATLVVATASTGSAVIGAFSCNDDDPAVAAMKEAVGTTAQQLEGFRTAADQMLSGVRSVALADSALDRAAVRADGADARARAQARVIATNALGDLEEWKALQGLSARRAREAVYRAQQWSFVARRAFEYRAGLDMPRMRRASSRTPAPASWVNEVFDIDARTEGTVNIAGRALVDHVSQLESFVAAYPFDYRFADGRDEQLLSLGRLAPGQAPDATQSVPLVQRLSYVCHDGAIDSASPTTWGDPVAVFQPCASNGGVEYAEMRLSIDGQLRGYLGERLATRNFNYRIRDVAVNLTGVGVIDCERVPAWRRLECYADATVFYDLRQDGLVEVENYEHDFTRFDAEPGVIQSARALAAERVLTNPLSVVDRGLIDGFRAYELWGRPLAGQYTVRIYDNGAVAWDRLDDVQLLLEYDYWTRQE